MGQSNVSMFKKIKLDNDENRKRDELQTMLTTRLRVCIDYRKLNVGIKKDHSHFPFLIFYS